MTTCSICLEDVCGETKRLQCDHDFHLECILKWFLKSDNCPMCRASQKDDPIIKFKNELLNTGEETDDETTDGDDVEDELICEDYYFEWRNGLFQRRNRDDELTRAIKRAMIYDSTDTDLRILGMPDHYIPQMIEYQVNKSCPEAILDNMFVFYFYDNMTDDAMRRIMFHQSTLDDLTGYFLMSPLSAREMLLFQKKKRENTTKWARIMDEWKRNADESEDDTPATIRAISGNSTLQDLCTFGFSRMDSIDMLAYQRTLRVEAHKQSWSDTLKIMELLDSDLECQKVETLQRAIAGQATREDLESLQVPDIDMILDHQIVCVL